MCGARVGNRKSNGRVERALMDYVLITKRMVGRLKDVHVYRGMAAGLSDHFLVEAKEWEDVGEK